MTREKLFKFSLAVNYLPPLFPPLRLRARWFATQVGMVYAPGQDRHLFAVIMGMPEEVALHQPHHKFLCFLWVEPAGRIRFAELYPRLERFKPRRVGHSNRLHRLRRPCLLAQVNRQLRAWVPAQVQMKQPPAHIRRQGRECDSEALETQMASLGTLGGLYEVPAHLRADKFLKSLEPKNSTFKGYNEGRWSVYTTFTW